MNKQYLGDSVYAEVDECGSLVLTTENGHPNDPSNAIFLEPEVLIPLIKYIQVHFSPVAALFQGKEAASE